MKNAATHARKLKSVAARFVKSAGDVGERPEMDALRALVLGVLRDGLAEERAQALMAALDEEYVDFNELRVATELELGEHFHPTLGDDAEDRAAQLKDALEAVFDAEGHLSLARVANLAKREQRAALRQIRERSRGGLGEYAEAHVALYAFGIGVVPVDAATAACLAELGVVEPDTPAEEAQRFVEQNLRLDDCHPFFHAARTEAYGPKKAGKPAKRAAKKPA